MSLALKTDSDLTRFAEKYEIQSDGCWMWCAALDAHGYGRFGIRGVTRADWRMRLAHRVSYETYVGPIPEGLDLDHLCRNRACVNPAHLEPVSRSENLRRSPLMGAAALAKTHCPRGHEYDERNTRITTSGARDCRECHRARWDTEKYNPRVECDVCGKSLRKANVKKHVARYHDDIREGLGL